ncbi:sodium:calcium antiporter [Tabrizicola sp.]|uniref:sodium:calcium antiporter n=1 Tax=Tabrizicola sp. TaxID=2005166 RepID=UPI002735466C|nr:sodium:calcium antiporter [Tabrizicola sp.]MDP3196472.1 sodium:calcium antiporter [Tabrizicola sp.]
MTYFLFLVGLVILVAGGEFLVRGASSIARAFHLSPLLIGLTIVGFGTSAPELIVSVQAALATPPAPGIAIGNVIGSNISNVLLILGVSALIAPLIIPGRKLWRDLAFMIAATAAIWVMLLDGQVTRLDGAILLVGLVAFLTTAFIAGSGHPPEGDTETFGPNWKPWVMTGAGLVGLVIGARFLVDSATTIARDFGISEAVIGLTIVAVGTSLPEMATSVIAAFRKHTEISVGNIIGSNIFNLFGILGITALIAPIPAEARFAAIDMWWVAASSVGLAIVAFVVGGLPRIAGAGLLAAYGAYLWFIG